MKEQVFEKSGQAGVHGTPFSVCSGQQKPDSFRNGTGPASRNGANRAR